MRKRIAITALLAIVIAAFALVGCGGNSETFTVRFYTDGGSEIADMQVKKSEVSDVVLPEPTKTGYTFEGWYLDASLSTKFSVDALDKDLSLFAKWKINTYTVTFDYNGGHGDVSSKQVDHGQAVGTLPEASKDNSSFSGWFFADGNKATAESVITGNVTLTAQWTVGEVTVTFDYNGGSEDIADKKVDFGEKYGDLPQTQREGYTFDGWILDGNIVTADTTVEKSESHTLTAKWTANTYKVTFDFNGGSGEGEDGEITVTFGSAYGTLPAPLKEGYDFVGWTIEGGDGTIYNEQSIVDRADDHTLVANWENKEVTVTLIFDDGSTPNEIKSVRYDEPYGINDPARPGYTFLGWKLDDEAELIHSETLVKTATAHTLTAQWAQDEYTVSFDTNGGNESIPTQSKHYGDKVDKPADPTRGEDVFSKWLTEDGKEWDFDNDTVTGSMTLYANYEGQQETIYHTLTFDSKGGSNVANIYVEDGKPAEDQKPADPTKHLYKFDGWYENENCEGEKYDFTKAVTGDVFLYAKWVEKEEILIGNYDQLIAEVNKDLDGKYKLTADIDFTGKTYTPFGTNRSTAAFTGVFDGGNHSFKNITVTSFSSATFGVFAYIRNAEIKNLGVENITVNLSSGAHKVAGLVGEGYNSTIRNCYVKGSLTLNTGLSNFIIGGIACKLENTSVINCHADVVITGNNTNDDADDVLVGGLVASVDNENIDAVIEKCYVTGSINITLTDRADEIGGFIGLMSGGSSSAVQVRDCFVDIEISFTGPSTGAQSLAGQVFASRVTVGVENVYVSEDSSLTGVGFRVNTIGGYSFVEVSENTLKTTSFQKLYLGMSEDNWNFVHGYYPTLKMEQTPSAVEAAIYTISFSLGTNEAQAPSAEGDTLSVEPQQIDEHGWVKEPETPVRSGKVFAGWFKEKAGTAYNFHSEVTSSFTLYAHWQDTYDDYIAISDKNDLTTKITDMAGKYYLTADIDMGGEKITPIGGTSGTFTGTFDGNGHVIKNFKLAPTATGNSEYVGLFRYLSGATIVDLGLEGVEISTYQRMASYGALAGNEMNSKITNCYAKVTVNITDVIYKINVGGLVGKERHGEFVNCYTDVKMDITAIEAEEIRVGGIISGSDTYSDAHLVNCYSTGSINIVSQNASKFYVGAIIAYYEENDGDDAAILDSCIGDVSVTVTGAYSVGWINELIGGGRATGYVVNNTYVTEEATITADPRSAFVKYTAKMKRAELFKTEFLKGMGFGEDVWQFTEGQLPVLKKFSA